jgi:DNA-binding NtrC family response regulator
VPLDPSAFADIATTAHPPPSAVPLRRRYRLTWSDSTGLREATLDRRALLGAAQEAGLVVAAPTVSRLHAELEPRADGLWVRDLGSRNGTQVDGVLVAQARIPLGGRLRVGAVDITLHPTPEPVAEALWPHDFFGPLLGKSPAMRALFAMLARVAPTSSTVLIHGETGTGKELVARALHEASPRADKPLIVVDCAALPETLLESELFGHARGAFTGATGSRAGAFESAHGGTVFLDEVAELPLAMQPKLLRALESRTVRRLGEAVHRPFDVRFVSATHRNLHDMVNAGTFREDLYFRLAVLPVDVPPLRERAEDIPQLVAHFFANAPAGARDRLAVELERRHWPGNVRELRNFVERVAALGTERALALAEASRTGTAPCAAGGAGGGSSYEALLRKPFRDFRDELEREYVRRLLERHRGNAVLAAHESGLDRTYIYRLARKHAL